MYYYPKIKPVISSIKDYLFPNWEVFQKKIGDIFDVKKDKYKYSRAKLEELVNSILEDDDIKNLRQFKEYYQKFIFISGPLI